MPSKEKRSIKAEDLYRFELISDIRISPDGKHIIYSQQRVDEKKEKKYANLWLASTQEGKPSQFTFGDQVEGQPRWSPDGTKIAFLSNRGDVDKPAQIYLIPFTGGEARPATDLQGEFGGFSWSPDGKKILFSFRKKDQEEIIREKDEKKKELGVVARHYKRVFYKYDGYGYLPHERWHIWVLNLDSGETTQLTDDEVYDEQNPTWSVDGKQIAFMSNRSDNPDFTPDRIDLFITESDGSNPRKIETPIGEKSLPSYSPDGKWIAYYGSEGEGKWFKNQGLWIVPSDGSQPAKNLTEKYDYHVEPHVINDLGEPEFMPPTWSKESDKLYFPVMLHGSALLKSIDLNGENLDTIIDEGGVVGSFNFDKEQKKMAYFYATIKNPGELYVMDMETHRTKKVSDVNGALLDEIELGEVETVWIKGPHGNDLQGWVIKPPNFDPKEKYPSILEIHGGPLTQYGFNFMHEFYFLAAQGYMVHFSNPRGGRGYGEAHAGAIHGAWGTADYADLMAWTDYVSQLPYIDTERMGVTGGSYGGYMTVWIIGHTQRFKAAVTQRCVSNMVSMWGSSDMNWVFQQEMEAGAPFEDLEKFWEMSPIKYIGNAKTPTLVIHSENDHRCPIEQGEQVFVALKRLDIPTEFVRFPGEFHGLSRNGRTDRRIVRLNHIARWFNEYM